MDLATKVGFDLLDCDESVQFNMKYLVPRSCVCNDHHGWGEGSYR